MHPSDFIISFGQQNYIINSHNYVSLIIKIDKLRSKTFGTYPLYIC